MRIAICWVYFSGYMAACWRALAKRPGVELLVVCEKVLRPDGTPIYNDDVLSGINHRLLTTQELQDVEKVHEIVSAFRPQALAVSGWIVPSYRELVMRPDMSHVAVLMGLDTQRTGSVRQALGRYRMRRYFSCIDIVMAAGERSWQLGRLLGFPESKLRRGVYGIDGEQFAGVMERRLARPGGWPKRFLYLGRYIPQKAIDVLCDAYERYRSRVNDPWPLTTCGDGVDEKYLKATPGVENRGFLQPRNLPQVLEESGVFVLPSRYEPWGVVLAEAAYSGLPVISTEACGASLDIVRSYYNGLSVTSGDAEALARAMVWMHENYDRLPEMGRRSQWIAGGYTADVWAERWEAAFRDVLQS